MPIAVGVGLPFMAGISLSLALSSIDARVFQFRALPAAQTYLFALAAVVVYGAPLYAFLAQRGWATWLTVALIGIAPAFLTLIGWLSSP